MKKQPLQLGLFDGDAVAAKQAMADEARANMRATIERLRVTTEPPWIEAIGAWLMVGAFKREMQVVPKEDADRLWAEAEIEFDRLFAIWDAALPPEVE
jgi:hypothetical protein